MRSLEHKDESARKEFLIDILRIGIDENNCNGYSILSLTLDPI